MNLRTLTPLLAVSLATLGCAAKAIDLDTPPVIEPSAEPDVLGTVPEYVTKLIVDDQRLYWAGVAGTRTFIQSCEKQNCVATLITYDAQPYGNDSVLAVRVGQVYWYRINTGELLSCPRAGCNGTPRIVATKFSGSLGVGSSAFDDDQFFFTDPTQRDATTIFSISLAHPGPPQPLATSGIAAVVGLDSNYVYRFTHSGDQRLGELARIPKGGGAAETIATDVKQTYYEWFAVRIEQTAIYWTNNVLAGSINRCPIMGCAGSSEIVVGPVRAPQNVLIDGSDLYYVYEAPSGDLALATCELPACSQSTNLPLPEGLFKPNLLALDDQDLYLVTSKQDWPSPTPDTAVSVSMNIRRLTKLNRGR